MPTIRTRLLLTGVLLTSVALSFAWLEKPEKLAAKEAGLNAAKLRRLDALLQDAVDREQIAGAVALLARHGRIGYLKATGWRDAESHIAMTHDTLFRIASMTKPITSVAAMMLVEDGKLHLSDGVSKFIPEFKNAVVGVPNLTTWRLQQEPAEREITIRDLLTHTSGLTYRSWGLQPWETLYREAGVSDGVLHPPGGSIGNVRRLAKLPLLFHPGSLWGYGLSSDVLGVVIEEASGQDLATFLHQRIFAPLKMHDTCFFVPQAKRDRLAALYQMGSDGKRRRVGDETVAVGGLRFSATYPCEEDGNFFSGGAGLVSSTHDYARFLQMLLGGGELDGARLLQAATIKEMTTNQIGSMKIYIPPYGDRYGYGFGVRTEEGSSPDAASVGSYAWGGIFHTSFWVDPKKDLIGVLMLQLFVAGDLPLRQEFKRRAYECLAD